MTVQRRVKLILLYEPNWNFEAVTGIGTFLWAVMACLTDDYTIVGWQWTVPVLGLLLGALRLVLLGTLNPLFRVLGGMVGFVWWGWIAYAALKAFGAVPAAGLEIAAACGELLTVMRFSLRAAVDRVKYE